MGEQTQNNLGSIQEAINQAENGSTIYVPAGIYFEHVIINKTISIVGENVSTTIIDGTSSGTVVTITTDSVSITGFTIRNSGWGWTRNGIYVHKADNCHIEENLLITNCHNIRLNHSRNSRVLGNNIKGNGYGIRLINTFNCTAIGNNVSDVIGAIHLQNATSCVVRRNYVTESNQGIRLYSPDVYNMIMENTVYNNTYDGMIEAMPGNTTFFRNFIFHNNFIDNSYPFICRVSGNFWDRGYPDGGNFWSRYSGVDSYSGLYQNETDCDGIGDAPFTVAAYNRDNYPLVHPYGSIRNIDTDQVYLTIQSAIDASETLNGHTILIRSGIYHENIEISKPLKLIGENRSSIIDGRRKDTVVQVNADNVTVAGFTIRNSGLSFPPYGMHCGLLLDHASGSNISNNSIKDNLIGIFLSFSQRNTLAYNTVSSNQDKGVCLWYSGENTLFGNQIFNNLYNFGVSGGDDADFLNSIDTSNTVDGKPIYYVIGVENRVFNQPDIGVLYLVDCANIIVENLHLAGNGHGVFFYNTSNSRIENVTVSKNSYGIYVQNSVNNTVAFSYCSQNWVGICLLGSRNVTIDGNTAASNEKGISLYEADNNLIVRNTLSNNLYGIRFFDSGLNQVFHNNLIENTHQADLIVSYKNVWDNGFEGNYWSDYNGTDTSTPLDGIGETNVPWHGLDYYPLTNFHWNPADLNHDLRIDIKDISSAAKAFGAYPSHPRWSRLADVNEDQIIDIRDLVLIAKSFGKTFG
jgi:parallel beta-helix repeat protein